MLPEESEELLGSVDDRILDKEFSWCSLWEEIGSMVPLAAPVSFGYLLQMTLNMGAILVLGHESTTALAAMTLTTLYVNITGYSLIIGMASAVDTLCSQSHGFNSSQTPGSCNNLQTGILLRAIAILSFIFAIPATFVWIFATEALLLFLGQDAEVASLTAEFTTALVPTLFPHVIGECLKRYLMAQGIMSAPMAIIAIVSPINILLQYILVLSPYKIGAVGSSYALCISQFLITGFLLIYVKVYNLLGEFNWSEALQSDKIITFVKLGVPGVIMTCSEWWAFEIISLASGLLSPEYLAAQSVIVSISVLCYTLPLGISIAASARIGYYIGAGLKHRAKTSSWAAVFLGLCVAVINSAVLILVRRLWARLFTDDVVVIDIVIGVLPISAGFQTSDAISAVSSGILRGIGRQDIGAYLNTFGYYFFGIPIGMLVCFYWKWNLIGLWSGLALASGLVAIVQISVIYNTNWRKESENAELRINGGIRDRGDLEVE